MTFMEWRKFRDQGGILLGLIDDIPDSRKKAEYWGKIFHVAKLENRFR